MRTGLAGEAANVINDRAGAELAGDNTGAEQTSSDHFVILKVFKINLRF